MGLDQHARSGANVATMSSVPPHYQYRQTPAQMQQMQAYAQVQMSGGHSAGMMGTPTRMPVGYPMAQVRPMQGYQTPRGNPQYPVQYDRSQLFRSASQPSPGSRQFVRTATRPVGHGNGPQRILLSLASRLPNEVEWALRILLRLSAGQRDFTISSIPGLVEEIADFLADTFPKVEAKENIETWSELHEHDVPSIERGTVILQIVYNLSLGSIENARALGSSNVLLGTVLRLAESCDNYDIKMLASHTLEHIAGAAYIVTGKDDVIVGFACRSSAMLTTTDGVPDRALLMSALRTYTYLLNLEMNQKVLIPHLTGRKKFWTSIFNYLLLVLDAAMISTILDFIYTYTLADISPILSLPPSVNPVRMMLRLVKIQLPAPFGSYDKWMNLGHIADTKKDPVHQTPDFVQHQTEMNGTSRYDIQGIPLTAVLVLRNIAKGQDDQLQDFFLPCMEELIILTATYPSMSYWVNLVLSELGHAS